MKYDYRCRYSGCHVMPRMDFADPAFQGFTAGPHSSCQAGAAGGFPAAGTGGRKRKIPEAGR